MKKVSFLGDDTFGVRNDSEVSTLHGGNWASQIDGGTSGLHLDSIRDIVHQDVGFRA